MLKKDDGANQHVYGESVASRRVLLEPEQRIPVAARGFVAALERLSPSSR